EPRQARPPRPRGGRVGGAGPRGPGPARTVLTSSLASGADVGHGGRHPPQLPRRSLEVVMKIVVVGALGKVARHLLPLLTKSGHDVVGVVRKPEQLDAVTDLGAEALLLDVETSST